ncbi:MAG: hypothetical protein LBK07_00215 [Tannerella sp.]|jgi:hypothetical protein|nr:hypothetical protein [Tannerella sp.]
MKMKTSNKQIISIAALLILCGCGSPKRPSVEKVPDAYGFFPISGVYLGQTTVDELWDMGYKPDVEKDSYDCYIDGRAFYDNDKDRLFEKLFISYYSDTNDPTPVEWKEKFGFARELSQSQWLTLLKKHRLSVEEASLRQIIATTPDKSLKFKLEFKNEIKDKNTPSALYWLTIYYNGERIE